MARSKVIAYNGQGGMDMTTGRLMESVDPCNTVPPEKKEKKAKAKGKPSKSMKLA